jgi:hypothetical protein
LKAISSQTPSRHRPSLSWLSQILSSRTFLNQQQSLKNHSPHPEEARSAVSKDGPGHQRLPHILRDGPSALLRMRPGVAPHNFGIPQRIVIPDAAKRRSGIQHPSVDVWVDRVLNELKFRLSRNDKTGAALSLSRTSTLEAHPLNVELACVHCNRL